MHVERPVYLLDGSQGISDERVDSQFNSNSEYVQKKRSIHTRSLFSHINPRKLSTKEKQREPYYMAVAIALLEGTYPEGSGVYISVPWNKGVFSWSKASGLPLESVAPALADAEALADAAGAGAGVGAGDWAAGGGGACDEAGLGDWAAGAGGGAC